MAAWWRRSPSERDYAGSSQPYLSGVRPSNRPKNSSCIRLVTGPALPAPTWRPSTERIGVISAAVPHLNSSSQDRKRVVSGKSGSERVDFGGGRTIKKHQP